MNMIKLLTLTTCLCFCCPGLTGCFRAQPVQLYALAKESGIQALDVQAGPTTVLVGPVKMASYLDQPRIVKRHGATRVDAIADRQWAGDLAEMVSNKLLVELGLLLQPASVFPYPGTATFTHGQRVAIDILRFEGTDETLATVEARWVIFDLHDKSVLRSRSTLIETPLADSGYEALALALSQGLTRLTREIAADISLQDGQKK